MNNEIEKPLWHYSMPEFLQLQKQEIESIIKETCLNVFNLFNINSWGRLDFFINDDNLFNNINLSNLDNLNKKLNKNLNNLNNNTGYMNIEGENEENKNENETPLHRIVELEMGERSKKTALIVVNVQNCFFRGGAMAMYPDEDDVKNDVAKEKEFIRKINQLISLFEEDKDYFNASLAGSPIYKDHMVKTTDTESDMELYDGTYPTGTRKKYFFDHNPLLLQ